MRNRRRNTVRSKINSRLVEPNFLPLIDVIFILLVFFIYAVVNMSFLDSQDIDLPDTNKSTESSKNINEAVLISVFANNTIFIGEEQLLEIGNLSKVLKENNTVVLAADNKSDYGVVFQIIDELNSLNIRNITIGVESERYK